MKRSDRKRPAGRHQETFARVLAAWSRDGRNNPASRGLLSAYLDGLNSAGQGVVATLGYSVPVNLFDRHWVVGRQVSTPEWSLIPVVTAAVARSTEDPTRLQGTVRVGLFGVNRQGSEIRASGIRFESAEANGPGSTRLKPHTYPHSQPCSSWTMAGICLLHPAAHPDQQTAGCPDCTGQSATGRKVRTETSNGVCPAVPLRCRTLPGLALAAVASIHGAVVAREILETDTALAAACPDVVAADFGHILGEDDDAGFPYEA